jgi:hypothetical protein
MWPVLRLYYIICLEHLRKLMLRHPASQSPGQGSDPVLPEYKVEVLTTILQSSIKSWYQLSLKGNNRSFLRSFLRFYLKYDEYICAVNQLHFI